VPAPQVLYRLSTTSMCSNIRRQEATSLLVRKRAFSQAPAPLPQSLKRHSIANFYKPTIFKLLHDSPDRKKGLECARMLWNVIRYDPMLLRKKVTFKMLYKIVIISALPPQIANSVLNKFKNISKF